MHVNTANKILTKLSVIGKELEDLETLAWNHRQEELLQALKKLREDVDKVKDTLRHRGHEGLSNKR